MTDVYKIEFYGLQRTPGSAGFYAVDEGALLADVARELVSQHSDSIPKQP